MKISLFNELQYRARSNYPDDSVPSCKNKCDKFHVNDIATSYSKLNFDLDKLRLLARAARTPL